MKKILVILIAFTMFTGIGTLRADVASAKKANSELSVNSNKEIKKTNELTTEEAAALVSRLHEIQDMDKSQLTKDEKKGLRKEVLGIKHRLQQQSGVAIYL